MADDTISINASVDLSRAKKYHEGWLHHQTVRQRDWSKFWVVLRGNMLFICNNQRTTDPNSHVGTLSLTPDTEIKNLPSESKRKGFKFELWTTSPQGQRKVNRFKFDKENVRDLWKSYMLGISTGIVPKDVHLLPGQLKDIVEAIGEHQSTPPPLPTLPRPRITPQVSNGNFSVRSGSSGDSDASGSFRGHLTYRGDAPTVPREPSKETLGNIKQLNRRQADLALKSLTSEQDYGGSVDNDDPYGGSSSDVVWSEFTLGAPNIPPNLNKRRDANENYKEETSVHKKTVRDDVADNDDDDDDLNPNDDEGPVRPLLPASFRLDKKPTTKPASAPAPVAPQPPPAAVKPPPPPAGPPPPSSTHPSANTLASELRSTTLRSPTTDPSNTFDARSQQNPGMSLRAVYKAGPPPPSMAAPPPPPTQSMGGRHSSMQSQPRTPSESYRRPSQDYGSPNYVSSRSTPVYHSGYQSGYHRRDQW